MAQRVGFDLARVVDDPTASDGNDRPNADPAAPTEPMRNERRLSTTPGYPANSGPGRRWSDPYAGGEAAFVEGQSHIDTERV